MAFGRTLLSANSIMPTRVTADGSPRYKSGGATIDWATVAALGADTTYPDGSLLKSGQKVLRYGQVVCKLSAAAANTQQTLTGTATGGTFTLTLLRPDTNQPVTTAAIAWNASAAVILAAIQAVLAPGQAVSSSGGILPAAVTLVFGTFFPIVTVNGALLTGGTVTPAVTVVGATGGYFGPYDPAASDGRQTLARGDCFILDELVTQYVTGSNMLGATNDQIGGLIEGGGVYIDRVMHSGAAAASLALGPTLANLRTAFPSIFEVRD
jgi:hypothetical protein